MIHALEGKSRTKVVRVLSGTETTEASIAPRLNRDCVVQYPRSSKCVTIRRKSFMGNDRVRAVENWTVGNIHVYAFAYCSALEQFISYRPITLQPSVFMGSRNLTEVVIVTNTIPERTFYGCVNLKTMDIEHTSTIGKEAFAGCTNLKNVVTSTALTKIGKDAFCGSGLRMLHAPNAKVEDPILGGCEMVYLRVDADDMDTAASGTVDVHVTRAIHVGKIHWTKNNTIKHGTETYDATAINLWKVMGAHGFPPHPSTTMMEYITMI